MSWLSEFGGAIDQSLTNHRPPTRLLAEFSGNLGGPGRNRTDVQGFAVLCITTLPPGQGVMFLPMASLPRKVKTPFRRFLPIPPAFHRNSPVGIQGGSAPSDVIGTSVRAALTQIFFQPENAPEKNCTPRNRLLYTAHSRAVNAASDPR